MELNSGQNVALTTIIAAYKSKAKSFSLQGDPGTGKTFTTGEIVKRFRQMGKSVAVVAADNKALVVSKGHAEVGGWYHYVQYWGTAHQLLGLVLDEKSKSLDRKGTVRAGNFDVVIVDEASKLNSNIVYDLEQRCKFVLYVGDGRQLLPIGESNSPAFDGKDSVALTENVRQKGNRSIIELIDYLKMSIDNSYEFIPSSLVAPFRYTDRIKWESELNERSQVLVGTNAEAARINRLIRAKAGYADQFVVGDRIIFTESYYSSHPIDGRRKQLFAASETATVLEANRGRANGVFPVWYLRCQGFNEPQYITVQDTEWQADLDADGADWWRYQVEEVGRKAPAVARVKYSYAITDWRSQGGEYPIVAINLADFRRFLDIDTRRRMIYVAASRAVDGLAIYAPLNTTRGLV